MVKTTRFLEGVVRGSNNIKCVPPTSDRQLRLEDFLKLFRRLRISKIVRFCFSRYHSFLIMSFVIAHHLIRPWPMINARSVASVIYN